MQGILITARLKSTRLPRKALLDVNGRPLLSYQLKRLRTLTRYPLIICTSKNVQDNDLEVFASGEGCEIFRGSEEDVLERYLQCAKKFGLTQIYVTYADEPLLDVDLIAKSFSQLESDHPVWVDNSNYPDGSFGYGLNLSAIELINELKYSTENEVWGPMVSAFPLTILRNSPPLSWNKSDFRLTIDYPEDLEMFRKLSRELGDEVFNMSLGSLLDAYDLHGLIKVNGYRNKEYEERLLSQSNRSHSNN